jgi:hypothetical protein
MEKNAARKVCGACIKRKIAPPDEPVRFRRNAYGRRGSKFFEIIDCLQTIAPMARQSSEGNLPRVAENCDDTYAAVDSGAWAVGLQNYFMR